MSTDLEFKRGAIELLILKTVSWGPMHGYAIAKWIQDTTDDALRVEEGSLYPALHRLEDKGAIEAKWGISENNRQAKFYTLTPLGRRVLRAEVESWTHFAAAIAKVIQATRQPATRQPASAATADSSVPTPDGTSTRSSRSTSSCGSRSSCARG